MKKRYWDICPEAYEGCELAKDEQIFYKGKNNLGPCVGKNDCDEKLLRAIKDLGIKLPFDN